MVAYPAGSFLDDCLDACVLNHDLYVDRVVHLSEDESFFGVLELEVVK